VTPEDRAALTLAADILDTLPLVLAGELARRGLSQEAGAEQIGVDRQTMNRWIAGRNRPDAPGVVLLFRWLAGGTA
jgi:hypothetical protein